MRDASRTTFWVQVAAIRSAASQLASTSSSFSAPCSALSSRSQTCRAASRQRMMTHAKVIACYSLNEGLSYLASSRRSERLCLRSRLDNSFLINHGNSRIQRHTHCVPFRRIPHRCCSWRAWRLLSSEVSGLGYSLGVYRPEHLKIRHCSVVPQLR